MKAGWKSLVKCGLLIAAAALWLSGGHASAADTWGTLKGRFIVKGEVPEPAKFAIAKDPEVCGKHDLRDESVVVGSDGGLANVVIYLRTEKVDIHPDYAASENDTLVFDNKNCRFEPHILPIRVSQTLELHNSDPVAHNSNLTPIGDKGINPQIPPNGKVPYKFSKPQRLPASVICNSHPWMKGWIIPRDNPYVTVSSADGTFELKNLPAGKLEFQAWQEKVGYLVAKPEWTRGRFTLDIKEGDNDLGEIEIKAELFNKE